MQHSSPNYNPKSSLTQRVWASLSIDEIEPFDSYVGASWDSAYGVVIVCGLESR